MNTATARKTQHPKMPKPANEVPIFNRTMRATFSKFGLADVSTEIDTVLNELDLYADKINASKAISDLAKQEKVANEASRRLKSMGEKLTYFHGKEYADQFGKTKKQVDAELKLKGGIDAVILQSAAGTLISEKMPLRELLATNDPDFLRAAVLLPGARYLVLGNDDNKIQRVKDALAKAVLGKEDYDAMQASHAKLNALNGMADHLAEHAKDQSITAQAAKATMMSLR